MTEKKVTGFTELNQKISKGIETEANKGAVETVVNKRVQAEVIRRAEILEKAMDKYNSLKKELSKIKPDIINHSVVDGNEDTSVKNESYSDKLWKTKQSLGKQISELDLAIMKVFSDKTETINEGYKKLQDLSNQGGGPKKETETE